MIAPSWCSTPRRNGGKFGTGVTLDGVARTLEAGTPAWETCQTAYVKRFSEAQFMTQLGDFRFVAIELNGARQVAGFGAARSIDEEEIRRALEPAGQ